MFDMSKPQGLDGVAVWKEDIDSKVIIMAHKLLSLAEVIFQVATPDGQQIPVVLLANKV